jgi:hypothetical protein
MARITVEWIGNRHFLRRCAEEIGEAKPEELQARNAGDSNTAQGGASVVGERNPGLRKRNRKPTKWAPDPVTGRVTNARPRSPASRVQLISSAVPRVPLCASLRFGAPLHPGLYSSRPHSRAWPSALDRQKPNSRARRSLARNLETFGKAEPFRTKSGGAAHTDPRQFKLRHYL